MSKCIVVKYSDLYITGVKISDGEVLFCLSSNLDDAISFNSFGRAVDFLTFCINFSIFPRYKTSDFKIL